MVAQDIIKIIFATYQDSEMRDAARRIQAADNEYRKAAAEAGRLRTAALIRAMAKLDIEKEKLIRLYQTLTAKTKIKENSTVGAYIRLLEMERRKLKEERRRIREGRGII